MSVRVELRDESTNGAALSSFEIELSATIVTLRDILLARISEEVAKYNAQPSEVFSGLVQPEGSEQLLNGFRLNTRRPLDARVQFEQACRSFERNGFVVLSADQQIENLDQPLELRSGQAIQFIKLIPLIGG